jgi:hypothetical protein
MYIISARTKDIPVIGNLKLFISCIWQNKIWKVEDIYNNYLLKDYKSFIDRLL